MLYVNSTKLLAIEARVFGQVRGTLDDQWADDRKVVDSNPTPATNKSISKRLPNSEFGSFSFGEQFVDQNRSRSQLL